MLFVTLHGGKPEKEPEKNNVYAYDKEGKEVCPAVLERCPEVSLDELRGIYIVGGYLYVAIANKTQNSLICYEGSGTKYRFVSRFATSHTCNGILHPFDFVFDGLGYCYVSSQDTNVVTRLAVSPDLKVGRPAPPAAALPPGHYLDGTFVASSKGDLSTPPTTPVPAPAGLTYSTAEGKKHSVRGVAWANGRLFVVDQPASRVKVYDITGKYLGQSNEVETPVHIVAHTGSLFVSGGDQVSVAKLATVPENFVFTPIKTVKVKNSSGMTFGDSGSLYVASRTENFIRKFDPEFKPINFRCELPDNPEFLLHV